MHDSLDNLSKDEGTFKLVQEFPFFHILEQIFSVDILCYQIGMCFCLDFFLILNYLWMIDDAHNFTFIIDEFYGSLG